MKTNWRASQTRLKTHQVYDFVVTVSGGQVQRGVVAPVGGVDASAPLHEHFDDLQMALFGGPVQRTETVVVAENQTKHAQRGGNRGAG